MKNTILTKRPHFPQKCNLLPKMPSFLFYRLEKGKTIYILYTMVLIPAMQFTLYCCRYCHICLQYNIYIYIIIHITILSCYYNLDDSRNNTNLILNRCECNFQLQILHFLKNVLHPFMLSKGVFQKK